MELSIYGVELMSNAYLLILISQVIGVVALILCNNANGYDLSVSIGYLNDSGKNLFLIIFYYALEVGG